MSDVVKALDETIAARRAEGDAAASYVASLLAKGPLKCAEKFGEEAVEALIAASAEDRDKLIAECADALFHMGVMLAARDARLGDVLDELARRSGKSGHEEKAERAER